MLSWILFSRLKLWVARFTLWIFCHTLYLLDFHTKGFNVSGGLSKIVLLNMAEFNLGNFVVNPAKEQVNVCGKDDFCAIAAHYKILMLK